jgi:hypothetical protein
MEGIDVAERATDGRLRRILMFHGTIPTKDSRQHRRRAPFCAAARAPSRGLRTLAHASQCSALQIHVKNAAARPYGRAAGGAPWGRSRPAYMTPSRCR